ncbi:MAG TPA: hypothetical protein VK203_27265, partial [Nostocaceae cyanobacterium]|nr:hypothetical protein [Nostocaceae cyanobacterium]
MILQGFAGLLVLLSFRELVSQRGRKMRERGDTERGEIRSFSFPASPRLFSPRLFSPRPRVPASLSP